MHLHLRLPPLGVRIMLLAIVLLQAFSGSVKLSVADEKSRTAIAVIPAGREKYSSSFEGTYYIRKVLKTQLDKLKAREVELNEMIRSSKLKASDAKVELDQLAAELKNVLRLIEKDKVLVSPFKIHTEEVDGAIKLGPERLLVIHSDKVKLVGWDKPYARYVLKKIQLSAEKLDKELMDQVKVEHEHGSFPNIVGYTAAERKAQEEKYQAENGIKLNATQQASRKQLLSRAAVGYRKFAEFHGKEFDSLKLTGLSFQEGNRQIRYELRTPQGARSIGSRWRNHAELTVYVPRCTAVLVRGCLAGFDISGLETHFILTDAGSRDRDYDGKFLIQKITGDVTIANVPLDSVSQVKGNVEIDSTIEMANTGNRHSGGFRTAYIPPPRRCEVSEVQGNVTARFTRSDLSVSGVNGTLNVHNEYGDTEVSIKASIDKGVHRVVSSSGDVRVVVAGKAKVTVPVFVATNCGTARTNQNRQQLDDMSITQTSKIDSQRRGWRAYFTPIGDDFRAKFKLFDRPDLAWFDRDRSAGLDVISRSGLVEYLVQ